MARSGYCPSGRFFEASACGTPLFTDEWEGLGSFFDLNEELLVVRSTDDVVRALELPNAQLQRMAARARQRTLDEHTGQQRAIQLLNACEQARQAKSAIAETFS
jgi:spore maturation protein CgeB